MIKELLWRSILPLCFLAGITEQSPPVSLILALRMLLCLVVTQHSFIKLILGYLLEALSLSFLAWLFGRSIM